MNYSKSDIHSLFFLNLVLIKKKGKSKININKNQNYMTDKLKEGELASWILYL